MASIEEILTNVFIVPISSILSGIASLLPQTLITALLLLITYAISHFVGLAVKKTLYKIKIDMLIRVRDLKDTFGATSLAAIYSHLVKWSLFTLFTGKIIEIVNLGFIAGVSSTIIFWLTRLVFAAVLLVTGLVMIDFFTLRILESKPDFMKNIIMVVRIFLILILVFTSIEQLGLKLAVAENVFLMIVAAGLFAAALALGIGFGLAMKEDAKRILKQLRKKIK